MLHPFVSKIIVYKTYNIKRLKLFYMYEHVLVVYTRDVRKEMTLVTQCLSWQYWGLQPET